MWQGSLAEGRSQGQAPVDSSWPLVGGWGSARQKGKRRAGWEGFSKQTVLLPIWCPCVEGRGTSSESHDDGSGCLCPPRIKAGLRGRTTNVVEDSRAQPEERALPQLPAGPCALPSRTPHRPGFSPASPVASFHSLLLVPPLQPSFLQGGVRQDSVTWSLIPTFTPWGFHCLKYHFCATAPTFLLFPDKHFYVIVLSTNNLIS